MEDLEKMGRKIEGAERWAKFALKIGGVGAVIAIIALALALWAFVEVMSI
jgi:hypothetical protein